MAHPNPQADPAIFVEDLSLSYPAHGGGAAFQAVEGVSFELARGGVLAVLGESGSGKSTLTKLLQRLYIPTEGRILVDDMDIAQADPANLRRQIGVVLQENVLFSRTVRENIALANPAMRQADVIVGAAGVKHLIRPEDVKPGAAVLDVGVTRETDPETGKSKVYGDIAPGVDEVAGWLSPNPGGVGPMTVALLMTNVVEAAERTIRA